MLEFFQEMQTAIETDVEAAISETQQFADAINYLIDSSFYLMYYGKIFITTAVIFAVIVVGMMIYFYISHGQLKSYCKSIEKQLRDLQKGEKENGKRDGECSQPVQCSGVLSEVGDQPADQ